jgi:hypothetical protein
MKYFIQIVSVTALLALSGCASSESSSAPNSAAQGVEATVVAYEDGNLELRLDSGKTVLLRTPTYDKEITNSKGRRCRVKWKRIWSDDVAVYGWFDEITFFEWLEPYSSRFSSVWES